MIADLLAVVSTAKCGMPHGHQLEERWGHRLAIPVASQSQGAGDHDAMVANLGMPHRRQLEEQRYLQWKCPVASQGTGNRDTTVAK